MKFIEEPLLLCRDLAKGLCPASVDGYCIGGYEVDGEDEERCHG
jgi:hypothetical protein